MGEAGVYVELRCDRCGPVEVAACTVEVHRNRTEDFVLFAFTCPACEDVTVSGSRDDIERLLKAGARHRELRSTNAPPLTYDDLLDFHEWLAGDPPWPSDEPSRG